MNYAILIGDRIAFRRQGPSQSYVLIELAALIEIDDAQPVGPANLSAVRSHLSAQKAQQRSLAASIRTDQSHAHSSGNDEVEPVEQLAPAEFVRHIIDLEQPLRLSIGGREVD